MNILTTLAVTIDPDTINVPAVKADELLPGILSTVYFAAGAAAIIVIVIAGIFYSISQGQPDKIKRAKEAILYSVVGLVVIMVAFVITNFIAGRFA
ncbi:MAG: hypothetical protein JWM00_126 [Candidatus Saccharibacteria bacterium]|nr:hypothetical protein [Candidatus Saccharibacteria bacterium]